MLSGRNKGFALPETNDGGRPDQTQLGFAQNERLNPRLVASHFNHMASLSFCDLQINEIWNIKCKKGPSWLKKLVTSATVGGLF